MYVSLHSENEYRAVTRCAGFDGQIKVHQYGIKGAPGGVISLLRILAEDVTNAVKSRARIGSQAAARLQRAMLSLGYHNLAVILAVPT
jgi:hypothetical protein